MSNECDVCGSCMRAVLQLHRARQVIDDEIERATKMLRIVLEDPETFGDNDGSESARLRGGLWGLMKARATVNTPEENEQVNDMRRMMFG